MPVNRRPSGGLNQLRPSGGGICYHPLLTRKPIGLERRGKSIRQLSIGTFETISVIFPLRAILGSPEVIKGQSLIDVIIFFGKRVIVSRTVKARRTQAMPVDSFLTLLLIKSSSKMTLGQRLSLHRSNIVKIAVAGQIFFHE